MLPRALALLILVTPVLAPRRSTAQVLHERVAITTRCGHPSCNEGPRPRENEPVLAPSESALSPGSGTAEAPGENGPPPAQRRDSVAPDRETGPETGRHSYFEVFNPAVFPFKRMTALDALTLGDCSPPRPGCQDEVLTVFDRALRALPNQSRAKNVEPFWGSVVIDFEPQKWVALPSPGVITRIAQAQVDPGAQLEFARDGADNLFVRSPAGGRRRLSWLSEVSPSYFAGDLPVGVRLADMPSELLRPVPEVTRRRVKRFLLATAITVDREAPLPRVLDPLVAWFRSFETGSLPPSSGSTYLDLALSRKGSCRHRSYAFAVTAMAIGLPARYVENELHVFVEVFVPKLGWRRINLGGAVLDEELYGADDKEPHQPKGGDPFPQPPQFSKSARPPEKDLGTAVPKERKFRKVNDESQEGENGTASSAERPLPPMIDLSEVERRDGASAERTPRQPTRLLVVASARHGFRGETVEVTGELRAANPANLPVEIYLEGPRGAVRVGDAVSDGNGKFSARIEVPRALALGEYRVVARTPGDEKRAPSTSRK